MPHGGIFRSLLVYVCVRPALVINNRSSGRRTDLGDSAWWVACWRD